MLEFLKDTIPPENQTLEQVIGNIFRDMDKDGDELVSHEEFSGPKHDEF